MTVVLGLDLSLTSPGAVVWDTDAEQVVAWGNWHTTPKDGTDVERADYIADCILRMIEGLAIDIKAVEDYAHSRPTNQSRLGELGGIVKLRLWEAGHGTDWTKLTSSTVKKFATGNGRADKAAMIEAAQPWIATDCDDVADALFVAKCAADHLT